MADPVLGMPLTAIGGVDACLTGRCVIRIVIACV